MNKALNTLRLNWISQLEPEKKFLYFGDDVLVTGVLPVIQESGGLKSLVPHRIISGSKDYVRLSLEYEDTKHYVDVSQKDGLWQKLDIFNRSEKLFAIEGTLDVMNYKNKISIRYKTDLPQSIPQELVKYENILKEQEKQGIKHNKFGVLAAEASTSNLEETIAKIAKTENEILKYILRSDIEMNYDMFLVPVQVI